eukprot:10219358-Alexandrium_andersonii.AAC.1
MCIRDRVSARTLELERRFDSSAGDLQVLLDGGDLDTFMQVWSRAVERVACPSLRGAGPAKGVVRIEATPPVWAKLQPGRNEADA